MIIWDIKKDTVDKYYTISVLHSSIFSQISEIEQNLNNLFTLGQHENSKLILLKNYQTHDKR